ncbi:GntR family transcriptional regulator [Spirillospora sp. NPDC048911]|uniref:GntR family transcriptional regulator n=1 Tax=Spirillospora sp. NPDC048911 TaxID=3364527 RepID=UPI0037242306
MYVQIMEALRERIAAGQYTQTGGKLPSESALIKEFGTSRPTVVRALNELETLGEVVREHGKGTFVREQPASTVERERPGLAVLDRQETSETVKILHVGRQGAPPAVAALLMVAESAPVHLRRYVGLYDSIASELVSLWTPLGLVGAAGLDQPGPLTVPVRRLITAAAEQRLARVDERLSARQTTRQEAEALELDAGEPVLAVTSSVVDASGRVVLVVEVLLPGTLHELTDSYPL